MRYLFLVFCASFAELSYAQDTGGQAGAERLNDYMLGKGSALGDYVCQQTFSISSDAKSPVLLASNAKILFGRVDDYGYERLDTSTEILDGKLKKNEITLPNGVVGYVGSEKPPLTRKGHELFRISGVPYGITENALWQAKDSQIEYGLGGTSSSPFIEWPAMTYQFLRNKRVFGRRESPVEFLRSMKFTSSKMQGGNLVATFVLGPPPKGSHVGARVTFDEDMIVRTEWFIMNAGREETFSDVATKWDKSMADPLPIRVHAKIHSENSEFGYMDYIVDFKWCFQGSPEFDEIKSIIETAKVMPKRRRNIAGTEDAGPESDPPKK